MLTEREEMIVAWIERQADLEEACGGLSSTATLRWIVGQLKAGAHLKRPDPTIAAETWMKEPSVGHD